MINNEEGNGLAGEEPSDGNLKSGPHQDGEIVIDGSMLGSYFPWLERVDDDLYRSSIDDGASLLPRVSALAIEARSGWTFGELFPTISSDCPMRMFADSVRLTNVLVRENIDNFGLLSEVTLRDAIGFRNMGAKSIDELLSRLEEIAIAGPLGSLAGFDPRADSGMGAPEPTVRSDNEHLALVRQLDSDLTSLSEWNWARGVPAAALFDLNGQNDLTPVAISEAIDRIRILDANKWMGTGGHQVGIGSLLDELISQLGEKDQVVLHRRIASVNPSTLDTIGSELGVTRERVRQIESKLKSRIQNWMEPSSKLGLRAAGLRQRIAPVAYRDEVLLDIPSVSGGVVDSDLPAWMFLDKLDDEFESDGDWLAVPSIASAQAETQMRFEQLAGPHGSVTTMALFDALVPWTGLSEARLAEWLAYSGYYKLGEGWALLGRRSLPNLAAAYLEQMGTGTSIDDIHKAIPWEHSLNSLRNALAEDDRFISVARAEWELKSWGGTEYNGIRDAIASAISNNEGVVSLEALIGELASRLNVSASSVRTYAGGWPFAIEKGLVRFATERKWRSRPPGLTRNVYLGANEVRFRVRVNRDHLRGSGSPVPSGLAAALGLQPGDRHEYHGDRGPLSISWSGTQPQLSSIRQILVSLDSTVDDQVMLSWFGPTVSAESIQLSNTNPGADVLAITGTRSSAESLANSVTPPPGLAQSLELPSDASWTDIEERASIRGEADLVELLAKAQALSSSFDDVESVSVHAIERVLAAMESMSWAENERLNARAENQTGAQFEADWEQAMAALLALIDKTGQSSKFEALSAQAAALSYGDKSRDAAVCALGALLMMPYVSDTGFTSSRLQLLISEWQSVMGSPLA